MTNRTRMFRKYWLPGLLILTIAASQNPLNAAPNGLTQIPIAKVFGDGVADFSIDRSLQQSQATVYTTQYGIANWLEAGIDYQAAPPEQRTYLGNFKALLAHRPGRLPDIAFGMTNVATGQQATPYLVATTQPSATGISLGLIRPSGNDTYYGMGGIAYNVTPDLQIAADYIGGKENYGTIGLIAALSKTIALNIAYAQPNSGSEGNPRGYVFNLAYTFHLKGGSKAQDSESGAANKKPAATPGGS